MAQANPPSSPEYEYQCDIPYEININDCPIDRAFHFGSSGKDDLEQEDRDGLEIDESLMSDVVHPRTDYSSPKDEVRGDVGKQMNYNQLPKGIPEDEHARDAFDRPWRGRHTTRTVPKTNVSPRPGHDDDIEDVALRSKKPRQSLSGGSGEKGEDKIPEGDLMNISDAEQILQTPGQDIGPGVSGFSRISNHLPSSKQGDIPLPMSLALAGENTLIPPPAYELRQNIQRKKAFTYMDNDMSGNFDPLEEAKQRVIKLNKAKAAENAKQRKRGKQRVPDEHIMKLIVKLRFKAFGNVRSYTNDEDNWPDSWSVIDSGCERERQECHDFFRRKTPGRLPQIPIEDPSGEVDDLTGYPVARGCKCCRRKDRDCSLVTNGTYPCMQCADENTDCEPIVTSGVKGRCKQCVKDDVEACFFEDESSHAICDHCSEGQFFCDSRPPKSYRTERINIQELAYGKDRLSVACTVCRQEKRRCSLKKKTDKPPCKYCKKHYIGCTFFNPPKQEPATNASAAIRRNLIPTEGDAPKVTMPSSSYFTAEDLADIEMRDEEAPSRQATPEMEMEDNAGNIGLLTKMKTSFAHPIKFNVAAEDLSDCNFCEMPMFGIIGHFEREVYVIRWYNGRGYTEIGDGHCEDNGPTKMCGPCACIRLQIMVCPNHGLEQAIDGTDMPHLDELSGDLISAEPGSEEMFYQLQRWCSMCFAVAKFGCATVQPSVCGEEETNEIGCGLRLCERCAVRLQDEFGGDVGLMASHMDTLPKIGVADEGGNLEGRARTDVGFLKRDGLLMADINAEE